VLVRGLNTLAATVSTPQSAPVIAGTRLRGGSANTARGAAGFAAEAIGTARAAGCTGTIVTRADSGFYNAAFTGACRRAGAYFSVTPRMDPAVTAAIAAIPEDAWAAIKYPRAIWDDQLRAWNAIRHQEAKRGANGIRCSRYIVAAFLTGSFGRQFLRLAADALGWCGASQREPVPLPVKADRREQLHSPLRPAPPHLTRRDTRHSHDQPSRRKCPVTRPAPATPARRGHIRRELPPPRCNRWGQIKEQFGHFRVGHARGPFRRRTPGRSPPRPGPRPHADHVSRVLDILDDQDRQTRRHSPHKVCHVNHDRS